MYLFTRIVEDVLRLQAPERALRSVQRRPSNTHQLRLFWNPGELGLCAEKAQPVDVCSLPLGVGVGADVVDRVVLKRVETCGRECELARCCPVRAPVKAP